jgi:hypothetical protein
LFLVGRPIRLPAAERSSLRWPMHATASSAATTTARLRRFHCRDAHFAERLGVSEQTLRYRLWEGGWLVSTDVGRQMLTVRRTLEGCPRQVLHLKVSDVVSWGAEERPG